MPEGPAGGNFIKYRGGVDARTVGQLFDRLEEKFSAGNLFMDVDVVLREREILYGEEA